MNVKYGWVTFWIGSTFKRQTKSFIRSLHYSLGNLCTTYRFWKCLESYYRHCEVYPVKEFESSTGFKTLFRSNVISIKMVLSTFPKCDSQVFKRAHESFQIERCHQRGHESKREPVSEFDGPKWLAEFALVLNISIMFTIRRTFTIELELFSVNFQTGIIWHCDGTIIFPNNAEFTVGTLCSSLYSCNISVAV